MPSEVIAVEGIEDACKMLDGVGPIVATRGYLNGLAAAGDVMMSAVRQRVPVELGAIKNAAHGGKGALANNLGKWIEVDARGRGGVVDVGFGALGHIALWVEYGHRLLGHKPKKKVIGDVPAHPFMRPAFDACNQQAVDAFVDGVKGVMKEAVSGYSEEAVA